MSKQFKQSSSDILKFKVPEKFDKHIHRQPTSSGYTLPGHKYTGPGNSLLQGEPTNIIDQISQKHDYQYSYYQWKYNRGELSKADFQDAISKSDKEFLSAQPNNSVDSLLATAGIGIKHYGEKIIGQQYPSMSKKSKLHGIEIASSDSEIEEHEGRRKVAEHHPQETLSGSAQSDIEMPMTLPGTGQAQGQGRASTVASNGSPPIFSIPKTVADYGWKQSTYKKVHEVMTFGLAPSIMTILNPLVERKVYCMTHLAEIPWELPVMYLNPSEFSLLSKGTKVKSVNVKVIYRGTTTQFETNSSATQLATLNQKTDISVATGLNLTGFGANYAPTNFDSTDSMIVTTLDAPLYANNIGPNYRGLQQYLYGFDQSSYDNFGLIPPSCITNKEIFLRNYFAVSSRTGVAADSTDNTLTGGWPELKKAYIDMDGKTAINQVVLDETYHPKVGYLKLPLSTFSHGLPWPRNASAAPPFININQGRNLANLRNAILTKPSADSEIICQEGSQGVTNAALTDFTIYTPIEKAQDWVSRFDMRQNPKVQPSLHIGNKAIPALTSTGMLTESANGYQFTDTRAYWTIEFTMVTEEHSPTQFVYAGEANVSVDNTLYQTGGILSGNFTTARPNAATVGGLLPQENDISA